MLGGDAHRGGDHRLPDSRAGDLKAHRVGGVPWCELAGGDGDEDGKYRGAGCPDQEDACQGAGESEVGSGQGGARRDANRSSDQEFGG